MFDQEKIYQELWNCFLISIRQRDNGIGDGLVNHNMSTTEGTKGTQL